MKRYAILLGTEEYEEKNVYTDTRYCHDDVNLLKDTLVKYCDFAEQDVYVELLSIYEERRPKDILDKISEFIKDSKDGDTILFYYAGHGDYVEGDSYLILPHTKSEDIKQTAIPLRDISKILRENGRINIRIFDCCHSGQDVRSSYMKKIDSKNFTQDIISNNYDGWVTLASCSQNEKSYIDDTLKHGVFTHFLSQSIVEYEENKEILPEIIKISLCEKVLEWCKDNGKQQTPTLNASISGNISIAKRKNKSNLEAKKHETIEKNSDLISRISNIRGSSRVDLSKSNNELNKYTIDIHKRLNDIKTKINSYDLEIELNEASICKYIDSNIKKSIVRYFDSNNYKTIYKYKVHKEYEKDMRPRYIRSMFYDYEPKLKSIDYIIEEPDFVPDNYVDFKIKSDGYFPEGRGFIHISPLQLTICILAGIEVDNEVDLLKPVFIKLGEDSDSINKKIEYLIDKMINEFNDKYEKVIGDYIKYYEKELLLLN